MVNHPNRSKIAQPAGAPDLGAFVEIPFGARATQIAVVVGYARDGSLKVRAWNNTRRHWMPNARTVAMGPWIKPSNAAAHLPAPPAI